MPIVASIVLLSGGCSTNYTFLGIEHKLEDGIPVTIKNKRTSETQIMSNKIYSNTSISTKSDVGSSLPETRRNLSRNYDDVFRNRDFPESKLILFSVPLR